MPHLVMLYSPNLDAQVDITKLCRSLADVLITINDEAGKSVFPKGGTRVLAYAASHYAIADAGAAGIAAGGSGDYGFVYLNLRMAKGRSTSVHQTSGNALVAIAKQYFASHLAQAPIGITIQIDEGTEVFDAKLSSLHSLFN